MTENILFFKKSVRIREYLERARSMLSGVTSSPSLDAELLLAFVLKRPREFLIAHPEFLLSLEERQTAGTLLQKRLMGVPVAYLLEECEFYGLSFFVNEFVLIPRPETEQIVGIASALLSDQGTIVDIGTGSGCILISILKNGKPSRAIGSDISPQALEVARKNAKRHQVAPEFFQSDLFGKLPSFSDLPHPIVITANLPYVPENERHPSTMAEPKTALYSGSDGLSHYRRFFQELAQKQLQITNYELHIMNQEIGISNQKLRKWKQGTGISSSPSEGEEKTKNFPLTRACPESSGGIEGVCSEVETRYFDVCLFEFHPPQLNELNKMIQSFFPEGKLLFLPDLSGRSRVGALFKNSEFSPPGLPF